MTHADAFVLAIRDELRQLQFMVSQCVQIADDPTDNFGIAWTFGIDVATGCERMAFDVGYLPSRHTVIHEFGHDMHSKYQYQGIFEGFWSIVFGGVITAEESARLANEQTSQYQAWRRRPNEILADWFAWTVLGDWIQTETWGVAMTPDLRARLAAYFRTFSEVDDMALSPEQMAEIKSYVDSAVAAAETRLRTRIDTAETGLIVELMGALKAGFNVTLPTMLNRLAAGDKDVLTAPIDNGV